MIKISSTYQPQDWEGEWGFCAIAVCLNRCPIRSVYCHKHRPKDCCAHNAMEQGHCWDCYDTGHDHNPENPCPVQ